MADSTHSLLQWNVAGVGTHFGALANLVLEESPVVVGLQETCLHNTSRSNLSFGVFHVYRQDRQLRAHGGVALLVHSHFPQYRLACPPMHALEVIAVQVHLSFGWCAFVNVYNPQGSAPEADFVALRTLLSGSFCVFGDSNAHHSLWADLQTDHAGRLLTDWFLDTDDMVLFNDGSPTRLGSHGQRDSAIDLTFVSGDLASLATWKLLPASGSDHLPISVGLGAFSPPALSTPLRWDFSGADWDCYRSFLASVDWSQFLCMAPEKAVNWFTCTLLGVAEQSVPRCGASSPSGRLRPPPWWSAGCKRSLQLAAAARRRASRSRRDSDQVLARRLTARAKCLVRDSRRRSWRAYCSSMSSSSPLPVLWRRIRWFRGHSSPPPLIPPLVLGGDRVVSAASAATTLAAHYAQTASAPDPAPTLPDLPAPEGSAPPFTFPEFLTALGRLKNSAPGEDMIMALLLRNLPSQAQQALLSLFNLCWSSAYMPSRWKSGVVLAFLKPGKDPGSPSSYRPITLLSVLGKLFQHLIKARFDWWLESLDKRTPFQSGFRRGRRGTDNIMYLMHTARHAVSLKGSCLAVFLDIKDAFGNVRHSHLIAKLSMLGLSEHYLRFFLSYLDGRTACVRVGGALSAAYPVTRGVPQGAVLSPLLFSLLLDDLPLHLPAGTHVAIYADDIVLFLPGFSLYVIRRHLQAALDCAVRYLQDFGFCLSPDKCASICFSKKLHIEAAGPLYISGVAIPFRDQFRYLGVIFDRRLTWRPYIEDLRSRCLTRLSLLRAVVGAHWGPDQLTLRLFYYTLVRSLLDYAAVAYCTAAPSSLQRLDVIQNAALRLLLGVPRSTAVSAMEIEAFVSPLALRRDSLCLRYALYCLQSPPSHLTSAWFRGQALPFLSLRGSATLLSHRWGLSDLFQSDVPQALSPSWPPGTPLPFTLDVRWLPGPKSDYTPHSLASAFYCHLDSLPPEWCHVYTDASRIPGSVYAGFAFVIPSLGVSRRFRGPPDMAISRAELCALCVAVSWLVEQAIFSAVICSDSRSALYMLADGTSMDPLVQRLFVSLRAHPTACYRLLWTPSHVGVATNEHVDAHARAALTDATAPLYTPPPDSLYIRRRCSLALQHLWDREWSDAPTGRFLHALHARPSRPLIWDCHLPRSQERLLALSRVDRFPPFWSPFLSSLPVV